MSRHLLIIALVLTSVVHFSCGLALVNPFSAQQSPQPSSDLTQHQRQHDITPQKSSESNFWIARTHNNTSLAFSIPAIPQLDRETGPLPPGAYKYIDDDDNNLITQCCLIAVRIQPPSDDINNNGEDIWREGVQNCQKLIDAGFNSFKVDNCYVNNKVGKSKHKRMTPSSIAIEQMKQHNLQIEIRHKAEKDFYHILQQSTPSSVLRSCHFSVNMEIPSILSVDSNRMSTDTVHTYGNGWMVREDISNALLRTKRDCLDSVVLEYCKKSPYHLDVLDTLFEMQREGLVQSISTKGFPPSMIHSALGCGFNIYSNEVTGNLLNTNNLQSNKKVDGCFRLISSPLGGGLFTNQYSQYQEWERMPLSKQKQFNHIYEKISPGTELGSIKKWGRYRSIIDTLDDMSFRYQTSIESIVLRWLLQLNQSDSISVGTKLHHKQDGAPYSRQRDLRQVFTFSLEEADMERLRQISRLTSDKSTTNEHKIDFNNRALWV